MPQLRRVPALLAALILLHFVACGKSPVEDLQEARQLTLAGEPDQAVALYQKILEKHPDEAEAHRRLAEIYIEQGKIEKARPHVTQAQALAPEDPDTHYVNGRFLLTQRLWLQAEQALEAASKEKLFDPDVQFYLAAALAQLDERDKAIDALQKVLSMKPDYPGVHKVLGDLYFAKKDYDNAMEAYEQAVAKTPDDAEMLEHLALAYHYRNFNDSALKTANRVLKLDPNSAGAYNILGAVAFANRQIEEAQKNFEKAISLDPSLTAPHVNLGAIYNVQGKIDKSLAEYEKALALDPGNVQVQKNLGDLYFTKGELSKALEHYRAYHNQRPDDALVSYIAAKLIALSPDADPQEGHDMLNKFERATGLDVAMNEARYAITTGREKPTGARLNQIARTYDYLPDLLAVRAMLYERQKDLEKAGETLRIALLMNLNREVRKAFEKRLKIYESGKIPPSPFEKANPPPS